MSEAGVERRLTTILAADVVGYSRLMAADEAGTLTSLINVLDPDVIVLGGGLSKIGRLYDGLPGRLPAYVFSDQVDTPIKPPRHGDSSGVRGAAWLWRPEELVRALGRAP